MKQIGIKQLHQELKYITLAVRQGESFEVLKNGKPVFRIEPLKKQPQKKYTIDDFKKLRFRGGGNISQNIDEIVYGVGRQ